MGHTIDSVILMGRADEQILAEWKHCVSEHFVIRKHQD